MVRISSLVPLLVRTAGIDDEATAGTYFATGLEPRKEVLLRARCQSCCFPRSPGAEGDIPTSLDSQGYHTCSTLARAVWC